MKTIRWGMIGCGAVTEVKSGPGLYKSRNSSLLAVTSAELAQSRSYAARHGVAKVYATAEELVQDPEIDAVYIATPPVVHKSLSLLVARAGKHVYVEKPMAMRFAECQEIIDECHRHKVRLYVAFYRRAMERFLKVKEWLDDGLIGKPLCIKAIQHQPPAKEDLSRNTLPWRLLPEVAGAGKFLDMGVHGLDIFDFWFGPIAEAHGIASNQGGLYDVEDTVTATWRHLNGVQGFGSWCYVCSDDQDRVEIIGTNGRIEMEFFSDGPLRLITATRTHVASIPNPQHVQQPFIQSIVDELNGIATCPGDVESAARASWVADEILRQFRERHGF